MAADSLCVGDEVCVYSEEAYGFIYSTQSSTIHAELAIQPRQDRVKPHVANVQAISFQVCVANRYKLNKQYRKLITRSEADPTDLTLKTKASQAKLGADAENEDNVSEQKRQQGKKVLYGQVIQLLHIFSGKYVHVSATQTSHTESSNMQVELCDYNAKQAQFRIMPRYKVKAEGDIVQVDDQVVLESVKSPGQYLHVSKGLFPPQSVYHNSHEVNLSVRQSGFTVYRRCKPKKHHENLLKAGVPVRLFHKEIEAYLCAEGSFGDQVTENVHLRVRQMDQNNPKTLFPSSSAITYWQIEMEEGPVNGHVIRWEQQCRFLHMSTRQYITVDGSGQIGLTTDHLDPKTVFRLHPVIKEREEIAYETYCRIQHVMTGTWLHAMHEDYVRKSGGSQTNDVSMAGLQWTTATTKQITVSKEMMYDDAFTVQKVEEEYVEIFNYMAGMVPFVHKLIVDKKSGKALNAKETFDIVKALSEMKNYMIVNSVPSKNRQKLLRNLRIVELLVQLLQIPYRGSPDQHHLTKIFVESYDVLYTYLKGDSRKNELYIAKHISFFESQISYEGDIGLNAAHMVMELIKDNRKIVDRITHEHIDTFVQLLKKKKNYRYLDLMTVLCVCDGVSIPDNQIYITEVWLMQGQQNCVYHTELGQKIGKDANIVYVSKDNRRTWQTLHGFIERGGSEEEHLFLEHQLDLFGKLCYGRNSFAIKQITEELGYLTWDEAFLCLTNSQLPDKLRAKYCHLIISLFVDVGENTSLLDQINLTFVYDDVGKDLDSLADRMADQSTAQSETMKYFPQLREWINNFLDQNKDMTASLIGHNMLVEQVLRLVHYLVKYGFYGKLKDIKQLLGPLLSLLDGRNDKPYPNVKGEVNLRDVLEHYQKEARYEESPETKAIVDAKYQAMDVLDLFLNFRFNTRLERFTSEFKTTYFRANHSTEMSVSDLSPLLYEDYDIYDNQSTNLLANRKLKEMFAESSYFKGLPLTDILLDLSHYQYDKMNTKSMALLNRYYSSHDNLFKRAVQAQVLVTDRSIEVLQELREMLPTLRRLKSAKMNQTQTKVMGDIIDKMIKFCCLDNDPEERHPMNQSILYNHGILPDLFDILGQEIDVRLLEQYGDIRTIFKKSFQLMKLLARGNETVQQRLFDRLDLLLGIQGAEAGLAQALTEVFTGNKNTCMKILSYQVQRIMILVSQFTSHAPQFLDLLNAIVKVEELNLPLKRNQAYVMKYFMQYRSEVAYVIDQPRDKRTNLLKGGPSQDLDYLISLVDLLATCAEGENRFIESICQTIFSVDELLETLNDASIVNNLKRPYLRFLLWVYLNTAGGMIESGSGDLPHDSRMWNYLNSLKNVISDLTTFIQGNVEVVKQLLKKAPSKTHEDPDIVIPLSDPEQLNDLLSGTGWDWKGHHGSLHYMMEGVLPFLQVFFRSYYQPDRENFPDEAEQVDQLASTLMTFTEAIAPLMSNETHMKSLVSCMTTILSASTLPVKELHGTKTKMMEDFQQKYSGGVKAKDMRSDARKVYDEYYSAEEELNTQLNIFAINYSAAYGGFNDVKTQIGFDIDKEYTEIGGDEELPLGVEFQEHIASFIDVTANDQDRYKLAGKLVQQLSISASHTHMNEKERLQQEELDLKCLQLLRGLIHNEVVKLPEEWENNVKQNKRQLKRIEDVQNSLNDEEAMLKVLPHLSKTGDDIVREVLAFLAAMLFGGNENVQGSLIEYFLGTREEKFFFAVKNRMQLSSVAIKERRSLIAQHQARVEETQEQVKALQKAMKTGKLAAAEIMAANKMGSAMLQVRQSQASLRAKRSGLNTSSLLKSRYGSRSYMGSARSLRGSTNNLASILAMKEGIKGDGIRTEKTTPTNKLKENQVAPVDAMEIKVEDVDEKQLEEFVAQMMDQQEELDYHDDGYIELVLKIMGLMCDGQNKTLQDYLREQPDNIKSVNLVAETARFLSLVYSSINSKTINLVKEIFQTLVEFTSGNYANQTVVFDNKLCDYINYILRGAQFQGCSLKEVMDLKETLGYLIKSMFEENMKKYKDSKGNMKTLGIANDVMESLDGEGIYQVMLDCYQKSLEPVVPRKKKKKIQDGVMSPELHDQVVSVGFQYYHLLCRMMDLDSEGKIKKLKLVKTKEEEVAWDFYAGSTMSIEILKDDELHKVYFRVKDKGVLREDVKEKFKYEVDRSSPSNKLREFMDWSKDIMEDIKYTRKVMANPLSRFFVKGWYFFNMAIIFLSFVFFVLILVTWREPKDSQGNSDYNSSTPQFAYPGIQEATYGLGGLHNFFSLCVLISFFISNHPTLPSWASIVAFFKQCIPRKTEEEEKDEEEDENRESNLEVKFFSFKTIWYLLILAFSVLGTLFYGYFFSFHLVHIAQFNQLLKRAIQAVSKNGWSLFWVFVFGFVFFYIYALVSFAFYREIYDTAKGLHCTTMYECMVTMFHRGLILGIHEYLEVPDNYPFTYHVRKAIFDVSFFIIITTIGLNIIFGIIVDTFSELRDSKWEVDNDMQSKCFICSRSSYDFEHQGGGFELHVKKEHNQWAYLFFFMHLDETRPNDYSSLELYISRLLEKQSYEFFPLNRALSLQHEEDSNEAKLQTLMDQVAYLVNKMKLEETTRQREEERKKQQEWEQLHRVK